MKIPQQTTSLRTKLFIQQEDAPSFHEIKEPANGFDLFAKIDIDTTISSIQPSYTKRIHEYFQCSVCIQGNVLFDSNYAFGAGLASGSGGAIFVSYSYLLAENYQSHFHGNQARVGGAICSLASGVFFQECPVFHYNIAFRFGGAIYFRGLSVCDDENHHEYNIGTIQNIQATHYDGHFLYNYASELGGAICFVSSAPCGIEGVGFGANAAGISGGAIASINCPLSIINCHFISNRATCIYPRLHATVNSSKVPGNPNRPNFIGRGGGAIYFIGDRYIKGYLNPSDSPIGDNKLTRQLYTDQCCFSGNDAGSYSTTFGNGPGHEILLGGWVTWSSFGDTMDGYSPETSRYLISGVSVVHSNQQIYAGLIAEDQQPKYHIILMNISSESDSCNYHSPFFSDENIFPSITPGPHGNSTATSYVPSPTTFIYAATPITRLPYQTTSSWSQYTHATFTSPPTARTVPSTFVRTPVSTPAITPAITPAQTPSKSPTISATNIKFTAPSFNPDLPITITLIPSLTHYIFSTISHTYIITYYLSELGIIDSTTVLYTYYMDIVMRPYTINLQTDASGYYSNTLVSSQISTSTLSRLNTFVEETRVFVYENGTVFETVYTNTFIDIQYIHFYISQTMVLSNIFISENDPNDQSGTNPTTIIIISVICGAVFLIIAGVGSFLMMKRFQNEASTSENEENLSDIIHQSLFIENNDENQMLGSFPDTFSTDIVTNDDTMNEDDEFMNQLQF